MSGDFNSFTKDYLHSDLRSARASILEKVEGLSEYDVRRPLTGTGTNLLGLVKHLATWEARYLGMVFDRPFPGSLPAWDDIEAAGADLCVRPDESRADILDFFDRAAAHANATIAELDIDSTGYVPWWPRPEVHLFNVLVHRLTETSQHLGHMDILREQLDDLAAKAVDEHEPLRAVWQDRCTEIERAAKTFE